MNSTLKLAFNPSWNAYEIWLLAIDVLMLIGDLVIALFVTRLRYDYLSTYYYGKMFQRDG